MLDPIFINSVIYFSGSTIIRWTSKGFLVSSLIVYTIGIPNDIFGTNNPSMTSRWNQSALLSLIFEHSRDKLEKSDARIDGDTLTDI